MLYIIVLKDYLIGNNAALPVVIKSLLTFD
jgi:hypothetical protein